MDDVFSNSAFLLLTDLLTLPAHYVSSPEDCAFESKCRLHLPAEGPLPVQIVMYLQTF